MITQMIPFWNINLNTQEVYLNFSSLFWATGFIFLVTSTLYGGRRIITTKDFAVELMIEICERFRVTTFMGVPAAGLKLVQSKKMRPLNSLEVCMLAGTVVSKHLCESIRPYLPNDCFAVYGTSEGDILSASFEAQRYGSNGQLSPNVQMKIINEAGENLGPNEIGEICYKTAVMFLGYFDDPEETKATIKDGWIHSGDIGYFDEDGFQFVVDRRSDMISYALLLVIKFNHKRIQINLLYFFTRFGHLSLKVS